MGDCRCQPPPGPVKQAARRDFSARASAGRGHLGDRQRQQNLPTRPAWFAANRRLAAAAAFRGPSQKLARKHGFSRRCRNPRVPVTSSICWMWVLPVLTWRSVTGFVSYHSCGHAVSRI